MHASPTPGLTDSREVGPLLLAIDNNLKYLDRLLKAGAAGGGQPATLQFGKEAVPVTHLKECFLDFKSKLMEYGLSEAFFQYIKENYRFYRGAAKNDVLFTGYYEADLRGSLTPSEVYRYPLYRTPEDLYRVELQGFYFFENVKGLPRVLRGRIKEENDGGGTGRTIVPYYTREDIDYLGKLNGKGLEIVWIDNPIDVFFLHIQGSGIVTLDSGKTLRVNYDESNGHPYIAIGRLLVQKGILTLENVSMQSIQAYLREHPEKVKEYLTANPSYVFFREVADGPIGSLGVPVTPYRSIASDRYLFPPGALCYIETRLPVFDERGNMVEEKPFSGFVLNQDTGGAIRGPGRIDLFTGYGEKSKLIAGHLKQTGTLYFLIKKTTAR